MRWAMASSIVDLKERGTDRVILLGQSIFLRNLSTKYNFNIWRTFINIDLQRES